MSHHYYQWPPSGGPQSPSPGPQPSAYWPPTGEWGRDYVVGRQFEITLLKHTGLVLAYQQETYTVIGTLEQCERAYRDARDHCLAAGWWSPVSALLMNWFALSSNKSAIEHVRRVAAQPMGSNAAPAGNGAPGTPAGWYSDPAGAAAHRYWDGAAWTQWTNPAAPGSTPDGVMNGSAVRN